MRYAVVFGFWLTPVKCSLGRSYEAMSLEALRSEVYSRGLVDTQQDSHREECEVT